MRLRITLVAALASIIVAPAASGALRTERAAPIKITVIAKEFSFSFTRTKVPHGSTVIFTVINKGHLSHNLAFQTLGKHTPLLLPGKKATLTVTFAKKGNFYYICTVPLHAEEGMSGSFTVT